MRNLFRRKQYRPLLVTLLLLALAVVNPSIPLKRHSFHYAFIIDITQSMNARDYHVDGLPADRLSFAKQSVQQAIAALPCESKVSIGVFTTKNVFLLFEPLNVCEHYAAIEQSLMKIDWRMAWAADSHIARGLYTSISTLKKMQPRPTLVFMTDGQQTPAAAKEPGYPERLGKTSGLLIGVGNLRPVTVPKFDDNNIAQGVWQQKEAEVMAGQKITGDFLSALQENKLRRLAGITGLSYLHLQTPKQFTQALLQAKFGQEQPVATAFDWLLAALALIVFLLSYRWARPQN